MLKAMSSEVFCCLTVNVSNRVLRIVLVFEIRFKSAELLEDSPCFVPCGVQTHISGPAAPDIKRAVIGTKGSSSGPRRPMLGGVLKAPPPLPFLLRSQ